MDTFHLVWPESKLSFSEYVLGREWIPIFVVPKGTFLEPVLSEQLSRKSDISNQLLGARRGGLL